MLFEKLTNIGVHPYLCVGYLYADFSAEFANILFLNNSGVAPFDLPITLCCRMFTCNYQINCICVGIKCGFNSLWILMIPSWFDIFPLFFYNLRIPTPRHLGEISAHNVPVLIFSMVFFDII